MTEIVPLLGPSVVPEPTPHERFAMLRQDMGAAFVEWLRTCPDFADVVEEIEGTTAVLQTFHQIAAHDPSWLPLPRRPGETRRGGP